MRKASLMLIFLSFSAHRVAAQSAGEAAPQLSLLAGRLGGPGSADGVGSRARFNAPYGVVRDGLGNLLVTDLRNHTIRKIVLASGTVSTLAGKAGQEGSDDGVGVAAQFNQPSGLAVDGAGNLFVADRKNHTIRRVVIATGAVSTLAGTAGQEGSRNGTGAVARFREPEGIASDGINLFVTDSGNHTVRKIVIATGLVTTLAGIPRPQGSGSETGQSVQFYVPTGIVSDGAGNVFVADSGNRAVRKIVVATGEVTTIASTQFVNPSGLAMAGVNLYVADANDSTIWRITLATGGTTLLAGSPRRHGNRDGADRDARFNWPKGLASDAAGNLFVADFGNNEIRKIVLDTGVVSTVAGLAASYESLNGAGASARFYLPMGVASDGQGNLFILDQGTGSIRKIVLAGAEAGKVTTVLRGSGPERLFDPAGVAADGAGNLLVAESGNHTIKKLVMATGEITVLAGLSSECGFVDGTGAEARFCNPHGLASDGKGNLYVADADNHIIRKINLATGEVTTVAGAGQQKGSDDGVGAAARFYGPKGVASDGNGNLFVADTGNSTIRRILLATGEVRTLAGMSLECGFVDSMGALARLCYPQGLASDGANLFIADTDNHVLRKLVVATGVVSTIAGSAVQAGVQLGRKPNGLNLPVGIALFPGGGLVVSDRAENSILILR